MMLKLSQSGKSLYPKGAVGLINYAMYGIYGWYEQYGVLSDKARVTILFVDVCTDYGSRS
jgi:hypothetical protein